MENQNIGHVRIYLDRQPKKDRVFARAAISKKMREQIAKQLVHSVAVEREIYDHAVAVCNAVTIMRQVESIDTREASGPHGHLNLQIRPRRKRHLGRLPLPVVSMTAIV